MGRLFRRILLLLVILGLLLGGATIIGRAEEMPPLLLELWLPVVYKDKLGEFPPCDCPPENDVCVCY